MGRGPLSSTRMLTSLTVPAVVLLVGLPGLGFLPGFRAKSRVEPAAVDTLPPAWKPASLLALESFLVRGALPVLGPEPASFTLHGDPRRLRVALDSDSGHVRVIPEMGQVPLGGGTRQPLDAYAEDLTWRNFRRQWAERSRQRINLLGEQSQSRPPTGLSLQLPSPLPKRIQSLLGPGGPALNVSGSENIRLSGQSNWSNQQTGPLGQRQSLFPSLDMQQDLDIRLEGQLSDRVRVNLLQNSGVQIPLANRIAINYKGDEDDLVQQLDLGNTNLSLPGTQFVSYSGKNEGLFGVKAASKVGPLDFTILASKQEGRSERASYTGGALKQEQTLRDLDYLKGVYFLLYDPNGPAYEIPDSSIRVYLDDANYSNDVNTVRGWAFVDPLAPDSAAADPQGTRGAYSIRGTFTQLNPGSDQDFEILRDVYGPLYKVIRLNRPMNSRLQQRLAVTYVRRDVDASGRGVGNFVRVGGRDTLDRDGEPARTMKLLWAPPQLMKARDSDFFDSNLTLTATRELELRNFYQLSGRRIDPLTLQITIRRGTDFPYVTNLNLPGQTPIPYIEVLGLDNFDETTGTAVRGHDQKVDGTFATSDTRLFVDFENGTLFFFDLRPFAPRIGPQGRRFENTLNDRLYRRATLVDVPNGEGLNPGIYDKYILQRDTDTDYYIDVEFNAARAGGEITLGRTNIIEGSDVVMINGQVLTRDRDYTIDYDLGRLSLKRQLGPSDQLGVDYSYAPLFQQAGRTLLGSAFRLQGRDRSFGGAFMYESKGAQDLRPRLGEEPSRSLIADLNSDFTFRPDWLTRLVDRLPGVRTTAPSELRIQAEVGASFPNPNTRNEVYIDDMEGVRDAVALSMGTERWNWSSVPSRADSTFNGRALFPKTMLELQDEGKRVHHSELHWYSPYSVVKERDLKPTLTDAQGAQNIRQVLALSIPRRPLRANNVPATLDTLWAGLTYTLDQAGLDLSKSQFIELWVNDFNDQQRVRRPHVKLRVDLGVVSEDQMRSPDVRPNRRLDSEDQEPRDNQLVVTSGTNEDTGLDGWLVATERDSIPPRSQPPLYRDLVTASAADPQGDDFKEPVEGLKEIDPRRYVFTNGTEGNKVIYPFPDTEDLNLNNNLDTEEDYYQFTIDLGDTNFLITDLQRDFPGLVAADNGWRRYRIPVVDPRRVQFGAPDLTLIRHLRLWLDGVTSPDPPPDGNNVQRPLLMVGSLEIVGSRWRVVDLDTSATAAGASVTLNALNTLDNADVYRAPFDPGETRSGNQPLTRREQSLVLEFARLRPDSSVEAFKTFSLDENYSRYGNLSWYVTGFEVEDESRIRRADGLEYFVRFASDERGTNYYEYRAPLPLGPTRRSLNWREVKLDLSELSGLKLDPDFTTAGDTTFSRRRSSDTTVTLSVKGRPSFTRLRRVSFGVVNRSGSTTFESGQLWFDELRATNVAKDQGRAGRLQVDGRMSNLLTYNLSWNSRDADFLTVGQSRGTGNSISDLAFRTSFDLHRFFEGTGIVIPIQFAYTKSSSRPRFNAGDDIVRSGAQAEASETFSDARSWQTSYSRTWSPQSNPFLRYTVGGITATVGGVNAHGHNPNALSRNNAINTQVNYAIAPRHLLALTLPGTQIKIHPLPERFWWNYRMNRSESRVSDRLRETGTLIPRPAVVGRAASITFGADTRPFGLFHHRFEGVRNLMLADPEKVGFINFGRVVNWNQGMDWSYAMNRGPWLRPSVRWNSSYWQDNRPEISPDLSVRDIRNGQAVTLGWTLPFDALAARRAAVRDTNPAPIEMPLWRDWLSRLGNVSTDAAFNWSSRHTRVTGVPGLPYLLGISSRPEPGGKQLRESFGNQILTGFDWRAGARTRIALGLGASVQTAGQLSSQIANTNGVETRQDVIRFPDLQVDYGRMAQALRIDRLLRNPRLRTAYNTSKTVDFNGQVKSGASTSSQWQPLLAVNGDLQNGTRVELSVERRVTKREVFLLGHSEQNDRNTDISLNLNRSYSQGQKVSFLGRESVVRSSVNLGLSAAYSRQTGETIEARTGKPRFPVQRDRLSVNGTGSYGFSRNVTGNVSLGFVQDRDMQRDIVRRNVRVEVRAQFTF